MCMHVYFIMFFKYNFIHAGQRETWIGSKGQREPTYNFEQLMYRVGRVEYKGPFTGKGAAIPCRFSIFS